MADSFRGRRSSSARCSVPVLLSDAALMALCTDLGVTVQGVEAGVQGTCHTSHQLGVENIETWLRGFFHC